jgi:alginate O-acetyltransferase complex protein AlgI
VDLHGIFLAINHGWHKIKRKVFNTQRKPSRAGRLMGWTITMIAVVIAWVPFRATSIEGAGNLLAGMMGANGLSLPSSMSGKLGGVEPWFIEHGVVFFGMFHNGVLGNFHSGVPWIILLLLIVTLFPNTQQLLRRYRPAFETYKNEIPRLRLHWLEWRPTMPWAFFIIIIYTISMLSLTQVSEFLYFQF